MSIVTEEYLNSYFEKLIKFNDRITNDEKFVRDTLSQHLANIPNGKLYKFRCCNRRNFKVLRDGNIYIPAAQDFKDTFDYTLNVDLSKDIDRIHRFLCSNIKKIMWHLLLKSPQKAFFEKMSYEQYKKEIDKYVTDNGELLFKKFEKDINLHGNRADKKLYKKVSAQIAEILNNENGQLDELANTILTQLNDAKFNPRKMSLVYCMSQDLNNGPLWEVYADNYKGFCIEYDFSNLEKKSFGDIRNLLYLSPVIYKKDKPYLDLYPIFELAFMEGIFNEKMVFDHSLQIDINRQLLYKQERYSFEQEWRFAIKNEGNNLQPFPFVNAIYMGKEISEKNVKHLKVIARKLKVPLYKQVVDVTFNKLCFEKVEL